MNAWNNINFKELVESGNSKGSVYTLPNKNTLSTRPVETKPKTNKLETLVSAAFPQEGWIKDYWEFIKDSTDAPDINHLIAALVGISTVVGKSVYFCSGDDIIYPNLYVCLIGPSSTSRKTTTIKPINKILWRINPKYLCADSGTPEGFLDELNEKRQALLIKHEFGAFLSASSKIKYLTEWKPLLTELYDCPQIYTRKIRQNEFSITEPFINLFGATTVDWFKSKPEDFGSGFLARILFIPPDKPKLAIALPPKTDTDKRNWLAEKLVMLRRDDKCEMEMAPEALKTYLMWFEENQADKKQLLSINPLLIPWCERLNTYFFKLSMLYELSINPRANKITKAGAVPAYWFLTHIKKSMKNLVDQSISFSRVDHLEKIIVETIGKRPGCSWSELTNHAHLSRHGFKAREAKETCDDLEDKEFIVKQEGRFFIRKPA